MVGGRRNKGIIKMIVDGDPVVRATVTYHPSMIASAITLGVKGAKQEPVEHFYQGQVSSGVILAAELITKENAAKYYEPDSVY